jgi:hypothetical protein
MNRQVFFGVLLVFLPLGCSREGGGSVSGIDPKGESAHIAMAGMHVRKYIAENKGKVPKNTSDLKDWAAKNNIQEDALLSTRDHQPYEVHEVAKGPMKDLILTETTGVNGKKFMWKNPGGPTGSEVDQEQIDTALKGTGRSRRSGT